ncbi:helix-turn-helix domain-containing protein [Bradyrhizobium liaoningense]|nr:helix-turn-helix domain-containing protein [Bradyrhizobium liaoningense]
MARIKILDVASLHGFDDVSTFNRAFRRMFDMSPSEARDEAKGED